jgi:serine/threonine protein kinase
LGVYLVAEFAEGESLAETYSTCSSAIEPSLGVGKRTALGLIYLEQSGEFHENLNPYNIIIAPDNSLKLIGCGKKRSAWKHSEGNFKYQLPMLYVAPEILQPAILAPIPTSIPGL